MKTILDVVNSNLCLGCGLCASGDLTDKFKLDRKNGFRVPSKDFNYTKEKFLICPGKGYDIEKNGDKLFSEYSTKSELIGNVNASYVGYSCNDIVLRNASSGGVMTAVALYLLDKNIVQGVVVTKFNYECNYPKAEPFIARSSIELIDAQGSKYCPVDFSSIVNDIANFEGKLAFIGTPCQIAGIREMQKYKPEFADKIVYSIGNFCGGYKNMNSFYKLIDRVKKSKSKIKYFQFRGGGQPGKLKIETESGEVFEYKYPSYVGLTGHSKLHRCHLCVDATAELADFACGDAWLDEYLTREKPWSIILARSQKANNVLNEMVSEGYVKLETITEEKIIESQKLNITSKKLRQASRNKLYKFLGFETPSFDISGVQYPINLKLEFIVLLKHKFKYLMEIINLYTLVLKLKRK
jgi:Coenzyme F420-reducing hydrogenase, beta subunit